MIPVTESDYQFTRVYSDHYNNINLELHFINGKMYIFNRDTLKLTEGMTEEIKQHMIAGNYCERNAYILLDAKDSKNSKWFPEEYIKFFKNNGYDKS